MVYTFINIFKKLCSSLILENINVTIVTNHDGYHKIYDNNFLDLTILEYVFHKSIKLFYIYILRIT